MHTTSARKLGETEEGLYPLDARRESPLYSERKRAALAWTEALTPVSETHAPDDVYRALQAQFTEEQQVTLTSLIVAINGRNRIPIGFRAAAPSIRSTSVAQLDDSEVRRDERRRLETWVSPGGQSQSSTRRRARSLPQTMAPVPAAAGTPRLLLRDVFGPGFEIAGTIGCEPAPHDVRDWLCGVRGASVL
jgi:hypothetical protein